MNRDELKGETDMVKKVNYNINWSEYFQLDTNSPSGLVRIKDCRGKDIKGYPVGNKAYQKEGYHNAWRLRFKGKDYLIHRVIWVMTYGSIDPDLVIDHLDGESFNNCISNLELKTQEHNTRNTRKYSNNKTGVTGVRLVDAEKHPYYEASWYEISGKRGAKCFSIAKFGEEEAKTLATKYREAQMLKLIIDGAGYTERHGI